MHLKLVKSFILVLFVAACASTATNPTTFEYTYDQRLKTNPPKRLLIANVNISGAPTRSYLRETEPRIDSLVRKRMRDAGFEIVENYRFENAWKQAQFTHGDFYDPTTGQVDRATWARVMGTTLARLRQENAADAIVFTDVIEHDIQHSPSGQHYARWYGVTRKPSTQGTGSGVPLDFNWTQSIKGASLSVVMYDTDGTPLFSGRGGLDTLYAVNLRNPKSGFMRRNKILENSSNVREGIELALHPLVPMRNYPGKPLESKR